MTRRERRMRRPETGPGVIREQGPSILQPAHISGHVQGGVCRNPAACRHLLKGQRLWVACICSTLVLSAQRMQRQAALRNHHSLPRTRFA